ncbi:MAG TPA: BCCT family transporter, partial [Candidatus Rothia avistercoris]|nr:BCCT family transporter [Candidatus Rothia avistercoris]
GEQFQAAWTTFYWGWWISWSPFVGMFIARVSKGRSVREFVIGVLLVPALTSFFWFSVLGGTALHQELFGTGTSLVGEDGSVSAENALFQMFHNLPGGVILTAGAVLLITVFFVTSADSGALVLGMLSTNGSPEPKTWIRVFWVLVAAATAISLVVIGGSESLSAIQTVAILTALPFSIVIVLMCISLYKALSVEHRLFVRAQRRNARHEIEASLAEQIDDRVNELVAEGVEERVTAAVGEHLDEHLDGQLEAALEEAVDKAVEAKVEEAVEKAVDEVALQVDANTAAIEQIRAVTGSIPVVKPQDVKQTPWNK